MQGRGQKLLALHLLTLYHNYEEDRGCNFPDNNPAIFGDNDRLAA